jgi:hypothetical protein
MCSFLSLPGDPALLLEVSLVGEAIWVIADIAERLEDMPDIDMCMLDMPCMLMPIDIFGILLNILLPESTVIILCTVFFGGLLSRFVFSQV